MLQHVGGGDRSRFSKSSEVFLWSMYGNSSVKGKETGAWGPSVVRQKTEIPKRLKHIENVYLGMLYTRKH